jgi:hypothetical protein
MFGVDQVEVFSKVWSNILTQQGEGISMQTMEKIQVTNTCTDIVELLLEFYEVG